MKPIDHSLIGFHKASQIQIDPIWCPPQPKRLELNMQQKWQIAILKANRLGAAGFKILDIEYVDDEFQFVTDTFTQEELDEYTLKRNERLSNEKILLVNRIIKARMEKGMASPIRGIKVEDLTDEEMDAIINEFEKEQRSN